MIRFHSLVVSSYRLAMSLLYYFVRFCAIYIFQTRPNTLSVSVDELLCDSLEQVKPVYDKKIAEELADCDAAELQAMLEIIHTTKTVIRKNRKVTYAP